MGVEGTASRRATVTALAAFAIFVVALTFSPISNNDIFLHLKTGQLVLEGGGPPRLDDYSALARGRPFVAHEWLAGVLFRLTEMAAGLEGLVVLKVIVALAIAGLLYLTARTLAAPPFLALSLLSLVMILVAARIMERPHIFSYLFTALYLWLLARRRREGGRRGPLWIFLPLQVAWANLHAAFFLGPMIVGLAAAGRMLDRLQARRPGAARHRAPPGIEPVVEADLREPLRLALLAGGLVLACLLNPYGIELLKFPFQLTSSSFMGEIYEWQPPLRSEFIGTYMAREYLLLGAIGIGVLAGAAVRAARPVEPHPEGTFTLLLFVVFAALSLRMQRNVTDFAVATYPGIVATAAWLRPRAGPRDGSSARIMLLAPILLVLAAWFVGAGYPYRPGSRRPFGFGIGRNIPVAAADYVQERGLRGNAFNSYAAGAYLIDRFYPAVRVAMDSRNDVYGSELYAAYNRALTEEKALEAMLARIDASFIFLDWTQTPAAIAMARHLGWTLIYFDDTAVVLVRKEGPYADLAAGDGYAVPDPSRYRPLFLTPGPERDAAAATLLRDGTRAARASGGAYVARVMQVNALLLQGKTAEAARIEAGILAERPPLPHIYGYLGLLRLAAGDRPSALDRFRAGLTLNPNDPISKEGMRRALERP